MKSIWFFLGLLITATIIFLSLNRTTLKVEYFSDSSIPINSISNQLAINPSRIRNFQEIGDINKPGEYTISFEIHPRNIMMKTDPLLSDLEKKIKDMITTNKSFDIKSSTNEDVFLSKITLNQIETPTIAEDKQQKYVKFINPELKGAINYLKDEQSGLPDDPFLDPRYSFDKGKVVLNTLPTPSFITTPSAGGLNGTSTASGLPNASTNTTTYDDATYDDATYDDQDVLGNEGQEEGVGDMGGDGEIGGDQEEEEGDEQTASNDTIPADDAGVTEGFYSYSSINSTKNFYKW